MAQLHGYVSEMNITKMRDGIVPVDHTPVSYTHLARQVLRQQKLTGERALFQSENLAVYDSVFEDGESPLKESSSLYLDNCLFRWNYRYGRDLGGSY